MKKNKIERNKVLILVFLILGIVALTSGITYSSLTYDRTSYNTQLVLGDIWMHYKENNQLILNDAMPMDANEYVVNPIMVNQPSNELSRCVTFFKDVKQMSISDDETFEAFCQGTGTKYGVTFQNEWNNWMTYDTYYSEYLIANNIMILDGDTYIVNPIMATQEVIDNELNRCSTIFSNFLYSEEYMVKTYENFCKGIDKLEGIKIQGVVNNLVEEYGDNFLEEIGQVLIDAGVINSKFASLPYFEFTIDGKNTYNKKNIWYDITLSYGDEHDTRQTRIRDDLLRFTLIEVLDEEEKEIFSNKKYNDLSNQKIHGDIIPASTDSPINKTYRLYMWISSDTVIGNRNQDYTSEEWDDVFASVKVNVNGYLKEKPTFAETFEKTIQEKTVSNPNCKISLEEDDVTYLSGNSDCVNFNYLWYSGKLWRITAIYPDGTLKLITDTVMSVVSWGSKSTISDTDLTSAYSTSYVREWLNQEFLPTLYNYENIIVENAKWYSITDSSSTPQKNPTGEATLTDPIGLLNLYEYYMSYQNAGSSSGGYLNDYYANSHWWLLNPYDKSNVNYVHGDGYRNKKSSTWAFGVKPVIVLKSTLLIDKGTGTRLDPYRINEDIKEGVETTLLSTRMSGEYVKLENDNEKNLFRIVDTEIVIDEQTNEEKLTTKIVLNDYIKDSKDEDLDGDITEELIKNFSHDENVTLWTEVDKTNTAYWRGYLNNTWLSQIDNTYNPQTGLSSILEKGTYYFGFYSTDSYKTTVCSVVTSDVSIQECIDNKTTVSDIGRDDYVGLLRVGEKFARPYGDTYTSRTVWSVTRYNDPRNQAPLVAAIGSAANILDGYPFSETYTSSSFYTVRPTVNLTSSIVIKSGSGTEYDPFIVGLPN